MTKKIVLSRNLVRRNFFLIILNYYVYNYYVNYYVFIMYIYYYVYLLCIFMAEKKM